MNINKMSKDELELLSNKDITYYLLEESNKSINTANLFKKIIKLLELPESSFDAKIGDYYTSLATDKRFILLEDGTWDLKSNHKVKIIIDDFDVEGEESEEEIIEAEEEPDDLDAIDDSDSFMDEDDDELSDLTIVSDDELEEE